MALTKLVIDVAAGTEKILELTKEEIAEVKAAELAAAKAKADSEAAELAKATDKAALLTRLGITADEAALLLS
jgi:hypothetical protein